MPMAFMDRLPLEHSLILQDCAVGLLFLLLPVLAGTLVVFYKERYPWLNRKEVSKALKTQRVVPPLTLQSKHTRIADRRRELLKLNLRQLTTRNFWLPVLRVRDREMRSKSLTKRRSRHSAASKPSLAA